MGWGGFQWRSPGTRVAGYPSLFASRNYTIKPELVDAASPVTGQRFSDHAAMVD